MRQRHHRFAAGACAGRVAFLMALGSLSGAAQTQYTVTSVGTTAYSINGTNNATLTLTRGAAYTFTVNASGHPFWIKTAATTGTGSAYNTGVVNNGVSAGTLTFTVPASAPATLFYICQFHALMKGTLNIVDPPSPPSVALTQPVSGTTLAAPATLALRASASDADGSIAQVRFLSGAAVLGTVTSSPYALVLTNLGPGTYPFTAQAVDNSGLRTTSSVVTVSVVVPDPIHFDTNLVPADGRLPLRLTVTPGLRYEIGWTSTWTNWNTFAQFLATNAVMEFSAPITEGDPQFFRAWLLPNP